MIRLFKKINELFIVIVLIAFYFFVMGLGKILHLFLSKKSSPSHSYWIKPDDKALDVYSAY